jgi:hypothetical protein
MTNVARKMVNISLSHVSRAHMYQGKLYQPAEEAAKYKDELRVR